MQQGVTHFWRTAGIKHFHLIDTFILQRNIWIYTVSYTHLDVYKRQPGDLAQRKGRIERQGNQNSLVHVLSLIHIFSSGQGL